MTDLDQAMAQAIQQFQSGDKVGGMFTIAHAGGYGKLDRGHAAGVAKNYSAFDSYLAFCKALWQHHKNPEGIADLAQYVHRLLSDEHTVSTEPKWSSPAKARAFFSLLHATSSPEDEVKTAVNEAPDELGYDELIRLVLPKLGAS